MAKINPDDAHDGEGPFVNLVKGDAHLYTPNGYACSNDGNEGEPTGAVPSWLTYNLPQKWNGNRSGE